MTCRGRASWSYRAWRSASTVPHTWHRSPPTRPASRCFRRPLTESIRRGTDRLPVTSCAPAVHFVSEIAMGASVGRPDFARRNRIIAGLAEAVVVVEAPDHSGALLTAAAASPSDVSCTPFPAPSTPWALVAATG